MQSLETIRTQIDEAERLGLPSRDAEDLRADVTLSNALQTYVREVSRQVQAGEREMPNWQEFYRQLDTIAREQGYEYGIPTPLIDDEDEEDEAHALILADRVPLRMQQALRQVDPYAAEIGRCGQWVRNSWVRLGDMQCAIVDSPTGVKLRTRPMAGARMRQWLDTMLVRSRVRTLSADAELKAIGTLRGKINESQFDSYMLNGCFPERSGRSDIHYIFRKGLPTLALSYHGDDSGRVIAALCAHPMGYYQYTFCGVMTPTDEVITHLLFMRTDERRYWAKSGQWPVTDTRAGV